MSFRACKTPSEDGHADGVLAGQDLIEDNIITDYGASIRGGIEKNLCKRCDDVACGGYA